MTCFFLANYVEDHDVCLQMYRTVKNTQRPTVASGNLDFVLAYYIEPCSNYSNMF